VEEEEEEEVVVTSKVTLATRFVKEE